MNAADLDGFAQQGGLARLPSLVQVPRLDPALLKAEIGI